MSTIVLAYPWNGFAADSTLTVGTDIDQGVATRLVFDGEARWGSGGPLASTAPLAPVWTASTAYTAGQLVAHPTSGVLLKRKTTGTSRSSFDATEDAAWVDPSATYPQLSADNTFTGKQAINGGGFTNGYDTDLWIAPATRTNPTNNTQGLYIQKRVAGDLGGFVHDAGASELRMSGVSNGGAGQNAWEASLVITGGTNTLATTNGILVNFHSEGTPDGTVTDLALIRASQVPALTGTLAVTNIYGLYLESQIVATTNNYSLYVAGGNSVIAGPVVSKDTNTSSLTVRSVSGQSSSVPALVVQNSTPTGLFAIFANGTGGMGGTVSGCTWWVNNNLATGATIGQRVRAHPSQSANLQEWTESGGTAHVYVTAATSTKAASLVIGKGALATNATDGFLYLSTTAGAPTGTPTAVTGSVPVLIDTTNSKLMAYIGGAWKGVALA